MTLDFNKPIELVTYDWLHEIHRVGCEVQHVHNNTAFVHTEEGNYFIVRDNGNVSNEPFTKAENVKEVKPSQEVFFLTLTRSINHQRGYLQMDNVSFDVLWEDLLKAGVVEDKDIEV